MSDNLPMDNAPTINDVVNECVRLQQRIKELEDIIKDIVKAVYLIDGTMDEKDMNNLWDKIDNGEKALEEK